MSHSCPQLLRQRHPLFVVDEPAQLQLSAMGTKGEPAALPFRIALKYDLGPVAAEFETLNPSAGRRVHHQPITLEGDAFEIILMKGHLTERQNQSRYFGAGKGHYWPCANRCPRQGNARGDDSDREKK